MKLDVPYYSQFLDIQDPYWMPRACGFCAMKMVYDYFGVAHLSVAELAKKALGDGGYGPSGLIHDYMVSEFNAAGLHAYRKEGMDAGDGVAELVSALRAENPVIVSADKVILGQHKFHLVVLTGIKELEGEVPELEGFYFNDPESLHREKGKDIFVSLHDFLSSWRGKAIFVSKK